MIKKKKHPSIWTDRSRQRKMRRKKQKHRLATIVVAEEFRPR